MVKSLISLLAMVHALPLSEEKTTIHKMLRSISMGRALSLESKANPE